jgi:uncharacterized protein
VTAPASPPALYVGTVRHRRFAVRRHAFRHRIALAYVDLEDLPRGGRLVRFDPADFLTPAAVRALAGTDGPIGLLAQPRSLGKGFNPVSFYYCHDRAGALRGVVAEVTSTPWGQRHAYVMELGDGPVGRARLDKRLHVSPFMGMDQHYSWSTTRPAATLSVHIESRDDHAAGRPAFDATLSLRRRPYSARRLAGGALRTLALIYAHALVLALKRVPIHPRPQEAHP